MNAAKRLRSHESFQRFDAKRKLTNGKQALAAKTTLPRGQVPVLL